MILAGLALLALAILESGWASMFLHRAHTLVQTSPGEAHMQVSPSEAAGGSDCHPTDARSLGELSCSSESAVAYLCAAGHRIVVDCRGPETRTDDAQPCIGNTALLDEERPAIDSKGDLEALDACVNGASHALICVNERVIRIPCEALGQPVRVDISSGDEPAVPAIAIE